MRLPRNFEIDPGELRAGLAVMDTVAARCAAQGERYAAGRVQALAAWLRGPGDLRERAVGTDPVDLAWNKALLVEMNALHAEGTERRAFDGVTELIDALQDAAAEAGRAVCWTLELSPGEVPQGSAGVALWDGTGVLGRWHRDDTGEVYLTTADGRTRPLDEVPRIG